MDIRLLGSLTLCLGGLAIGMGTPAGGDDWNRWRGPDQTGAARGTEYFGEGPLDLEIAWSVPVGSGYSGVSISDGRVLTMFTDGVSDWLGSFDLKSGKRLWRYRLGEMYPAHDGGHDGPLSTPVADPHAAYALGPRGKLVAVSAADGRELWSVDLVRHFAARTPFWGFATTPILHNQLLIVQVGGKSGNGLVAFDKTSGEAVWQRDGPVVDYRSPVLATVRGHTRLVSSGASQTVAVDPSGGQELWRYAGGIKHDKSPLFLADDRFLLVHPRGCELVELDRHGKSPRQLWESDEFSGNSDMPVYLAGFLYGFTGRYLTCVDATTGQRVWRSRPPGGKGLILVDGHLVIFGDHGEVVVVQASRQGYRERARCRVSDAAAYSWPAFADDTLVVRNLKDLVAVRRRPVRQPAVVESSLPNEAGADGSFGALIRELEKAPDKRHAMDAFFQKHSRLPIVEDDRTVHFVYRGPATDVGIRGNLLASQEEDALQRVAGTDLFYRTYSMQPGARWEYQFVVDYDRVIPDPGNPRRAFGNDRVSELVDKDWSPPEFTRPYRGQRPGHLQPFQFRAAESRFSGRVSVYLPAGYDQGRRHPLVVALRGDDWINQAGLPAILDHLGETFALPPIVALVPGRGEAELGGWRTGPFADCLATELVQELDRRYRTLADPASRTILGHRGAAVTAVYSSLRHPDVFGNCIAISYGRADTVRAGQIRQLARTAVQKPKFHVVWSRYDVWRPQSFDCRVQSRNLGNLLQENGFVVTGGESPGGAGWGGWRIQAGEALHATVPGK